MSLKKQAIKALKAAARLSGCICDPDISVTAAHGKLVSVRVAHDEWCKHPRDSASAAAAIDHAIRGLGLNQ